VIAYESLDDLDILCQMLSRLPNQAGRSED
jgi:hypothetical protein